jgi:hypothetical protein
MASTDDPEYWLTSISDESGDYLQGYRLYDRMPSHLQENVDFLCLAVKCNIFFYKELPPYLQNNSDIAIATLSALHQDQEEDPDVEQITRQIFREAAPAIRSNEEAWIYVTESEFSHSLFEAYAPVCIVNNADVMTQACLRDGELWDLVSDTLKSNPDFRRRVIQGWKKVIDDEDDYFSPDDDRLVDAPDFIKDDKTLMMSAIETRGWAYLWCSLRLQLDPDIIKKSMENNASDHVVACLPNDYLLQNLHLVYEHLVRKRPSPELYLTTPREIWSIPKVVKLYFFMGGVPHDRIDPDLWKEVDICEGLLWSAQMPHQEDFNPWKWIRIPDDSQQMDHLDQIICKKGTAFAAECNNKGCGQRTPLRFWKDFDLQLLCVQGSSLTQGIPSVLQRPVADRILEDLDLSQTFLIFLHGICVRDRGPKAAPAVRSQLYMLDRGLHIRQTIGDYLGVPTGRRLKLLRECLETDKHLRTYWKQMQVVTKELKAYESKRRMMALRKGRSISI